MKDVTIFETAVRLKEAGFPQPTPEAGQWWHNPDFGPFLVGRRSFIDGRDINIFYPETGKSYNKPEADFSGYIFAPTATDILRELKSDFDISCLIDGNWMLIQRQTSDQLTPVDFFTHKNPAEAAAEAWLELNNKK